MHVGIPREHGNDEYRVGLTPAGVELLTADGHVCYVESQAGIGACFSDTDYERAGARMVYTPEEAYGRADLVLKVAKPTVEEVGWLKDGSILMGFLHLSIGRRDRVDILLSKGVTSVAYETIQADDRSLPGLATLSQAAGRMAPQIAADLLSNKHGGKGILLGGVPGVPPAEVVIIGAGTFGTAAAQSFLGTGASVYVLDKDLERLRMLDQMCGRLVTMVSHSFNLRKVMKFADVLVGAVLVPGARAPVIITREMVKLMRPRSAIMDIAIDMGGCVETSRPTTHQDPIFIEENVIHYCVPNMTSIVARTATHAFNNAAWPYIWEVAHVGLEAALAHKAPLRRGVATHKGHVIHSALAAQFGLKEVPL
jgi:alanine dehydrogenase